jgi:hypothetical protein
MTLRGFALGAMIGLTGCNTIFDYEKPTTSKQVLLTLRDIVNATADYKSAYQQRANSAAGTVQAFEVPIIGTAIAAVATLTFYAADTNIPLALGLTGGSIGALANYYAPRQRMTIYDGGANAMRCVQTLAFQTASIYFTVGTSADGTPFIDDTPSVAYKQLKDVPENQIPDTAKAAYRNALTLPARAIIDLNGAIDHINSRVQTQAINSAVRPDIQKISDDLRKDAQNAATARQTTMSALAQFDVSKFRGFSHLAGTSDPLAPLRDLLDFAAGFDQQVTTCSGKAG